MQQIAPEPLAPETTGLWDKLKGFPRCHSTRWWPAWTNQSPCATSAVILLVVTLRPLFTPHFIRTAGLASLWWQTRRVTWLNSAFWALPIPCHSSTNEQPWHVTEVSMLEVWIRPHWTGTQWWRPVPDPLGGSSPATDEGDFCYRCGVSWVRPCWAQGIEKPPVGHLLWVVSDGYLLPRHL